MSVVARGCGGTGEVVRDRPQHRARRVGVEGPRRQVGQGAAGGVGDDLLDDRMAAVLSIGLEHLEPAGNEHRVMTPQIKRSVLSSSGLRVEALDPRTSNRPVTWWWVGLDANAV